MHPWPLEREGESIQHNYSFLVLGKLKKLYISPIPGIGSERHGQKFTVQQCGMIPRLKALSAFELLLLYIEGR